MLLSPLIFTPFQIIYDLHASYVASSFTFTISFARIHNHARGRVDMYAEHKTKY